MIISCSAVDFLGSFDNEIDCIVTDPPYGISYKSNAQGVDRKTRNATGESKIVREKFFDTIQNDIFFPVDWLPYAFNAIKEGGALWIFSSWHNFGIVKSSVESSGFKVKNMVVLNKSNHGMGDLKGQLAPKHELLLFASKGRHVLNFSNGRLPDIWDVPVKFSGSIRLHPNEKPVSWYTKPIELSCPDGGLVADPYAGSGTCWEAAIQLKRGFCGCDIDLNYVRIARDRIDKLTAKNTVSSVFD